jgi:hypothetical protein
MHRYATTSALVLLALVLFIPAAWAQTMPEKLSFQGRLTDATGNPVDGAPTMTLRLYTNADPGVEPYPSTLWSQSQAVTVAGGIYNVFLGTTPFTGLDFNEQSQVQ